MESVCGGSHDGYGKCPGIPMTGFFVAYCCGTLKKINKKEQGEHHTAAGERRTGIDRIAVLKMHLLFVSTPLSHIVHSTAPPLP